MKLGYFTMPLHPPGSDPTETLQQDLDQMVVLDGLGYDEAWIGEHLTAVWENIPIPDIFIAHALALTQKIKLGIGVTCMPNHDPFTLAHRIAQLDQLGRGRFQWGVGSGGWPGDFEAYGFDLESGEQRAMTREALELIVQLWDDPKPGRYKSRFWDFNVPEPVEEIGLRMHFKPYQKPHPPIAVAGGLTAKSGTIAIAGELGHMPMTPGVALVPTVRDQWGSVEEGARAGGKVPDRSTWRICREVYVADTTEQARKEAFEGTLARDWQQYWLRLLPHVKMLHNLKTDPDMPDSAVTLDYIADHFWIVGSSEDVAAQLRRMYEDVGGFGVLLALGHEWAPRDNWVRSMSLLKQEVMPKLADLN